MTVVTVTAMVAAAAAAAEAAAAEAAAAVAAEVAAAAATTAASPLVGHGPVAACRTLASAALLPLRLQLLPWRCCQASALRALPPGWPWT